MCTPLTVKAAVLYGEVEQCLVRLCGRCVHKHAGVEAVRPASVRGSGELLTVKQLVYVLDNLIGGKVIYFGADSAQCMTLLHGMYLYSLLRGCKHLHVLLACCLILYAQSILGEIRGHIRQIGCIGDPREGLC